MTTKLEHLLRLANYSLNESYETALENCFKYYLDKEEYDDIVEARKEFEISEYYFLTVDDFFKDKEETINSIKRDADRELIKSIDTLSIEELRQSKLIYNQIIKIVDIVNEHSENDCKLVY